MTSKVELANTALIELGRELITSLTDDSPEAIKINAVYNRYLEEVLSQHNWSIATFQSTLAQSGTGPTHSFTYAFQLPTDPRYLRMVDISSSSEVDFPWQKYGDKIYTDRDAVNISYIGFLEDPNDYGPHLSNAFVWKLISGLTYSVTGSATRHTQNIQIYQEVLRQAIADDSNEGPSQTMLSPTITRYVR